MYGYNYVRIIQPQAEALEKFNCEAMRLAPGLTKYTERGAQMVEDLMNTLQYTSCCIQEERNRTA